MVATIYSRRPLYVRVPRARSPISRMAMQGAIFAALLGGLTILVRRAGLITYDELSWPLLVTGASAFVALALAITTLADCWLRGAKGGWLALRAMALSLVVLVPFAFALQSMVTEPATADVSTDALEPPAITGVAGIPLATPEQGRRFESAIERVSAATELTLSELGWPVVERDGTITAAEIDAPLRPPTAGGEGSVPLPRMRPLTPAEQQVLREQEEAERAVIAAERREEEARIAYRALVRSRVLGVPSDVVIRLRDDGEATTLDLRARSREGSRDLGENRRRIRAFLAKLDEVVQREGVR